ncbi:MAG: tetratricopeptide repeat protein, partial [Planctomycetota bacterium]
LAAVRGEADLAQVAAVSARRDREVVARLLTLSLLRGDDFDPLSVDLAFGEAFSSHELDVGRLPATVVAEKIKGSGIAAELVVALDDWIAARREIRDGSGACRLLAILRLVDPMAARDRIRTLAASADAAALAECAKETDDLSVETLLLLGDALGRVGDVTTAKAVLAQARLRSPADFRTAFLAGFWRSRADPPDHARAVPAFSLMVALRPGEAGALYHYGQALHEVGDIPGALGRWIDALAEDPELYGFLRNRIADAAVSAAGKLRHASVGGVLLEELSRVAELFPQRVDVQRELGVSLARAGSWEAARIALARALWSGGDRDSGIPLVYSVALCRTGDEAGAIRVLSECARQNPEGWSRLVRLPDAGRIVHRPPSLGASAAAANQGNQGNRGLLGIGRGLLMMGAPDAALVVYEEICRAAPQSSPAELGRGVALHYLNQPEKAARAFQRASDLDPADAAPLYWLGSLRAAAGESEEAYRIWDRAFELDPGHLRLRAALTDGAIRGDTGAKAADVQFLVRFLAMHEAGPSAKAGAYEEAARRAPENLSLARGLARYLRLCGRDRKAVRAYVRALENAKLLGKQQGLIVANHATLLAESDDPEVRDLEAALRLAREGLQLEDTSYGHVAEGIALYRLGRCDEAVAALTGAQSVKIDRTLYLSMARMQAGDKGGAEKELDAALKTIRDYWAGRSLDGRTAALLAEACGLLGRPLPSQE